MGPDIECCRRCCAVYLSSAGLCGCLQARKAVSMVKVLQALQSILDMLQVGLWGQRFHYHCSTSEAGKAAGCIGVAGCNL
jgi:hypothetical protein